MHLHTCYSLRDSIITHDDLSKRLAEIGQTTVAITDHGSALGGVSFYKSLKASGIKMIYGSEAYICDDTSVKDKTNKYYHLVLLAKNEEGRINLNRIISTSERPENKYFKPRIDMTILKQHSEGLVVLSACLAGEVSRALSADDHASAVSIVQKYKAAFGNDYYLEIQARNDDEQIEINKKIRTLAEETDTEIVATCDAHYAWACDRDFQNKYAFNGAYREEEEGVYTDCYVQSEDEVRAHLYYFEDAFIERTIANTDRIGVECSVEIPLSAPITPEVDVPDGFMHSTSYLQHLCEEGFKNKLDIDYASKTSSTFEQSKVDEYILRYVYEIDSLQRMGFADYILLVHSYANLIRRRGIARGSGGGSLVCYLADVTKIDPVKYDLYFERFIDVGQIAMLESGEITASELKIPDIDLDFATDALEDVLHFLRSKYGDDRVASIGRFGTNLTKGTIRDMCKVLDIDLKTADVISKAFENYEISDIDAMICGEIPMSANAREAVAFVSLYPDLFRYVRKLTGLPKSFGLHPCGKIIAVTDLDNYLPSSYDSNGVRYLQGDMHDVDEVGLVKVDILGLRTVNQEYDTLAMSGESDDFVDTNQDMSDENVMSIFRNCDTVGIFQFASRGMQETLKKMVVRNLDDLAIANALYRPGPMQYIDTFCNRRHGRERFLYIHPDLEPILNNTYGIMIFQEQLIAIGRMAGIRNPDLLRKATGKKDPKLLRKIKPELHDKLMDRGWNECQFEELWDAMIEFSMYSFNKSHSYAYSMLAYLTAKQKAYYPAEFYAGLLNSYLGESSFVKDNADEISSDIFRHNVKILPFSYLQDHRRCSVKDGAIVYAIPLIRDCSQMVAEQVYYASGMQFTHFWRLANHLSNNGVNKSQLQILIKLGFFSTFGNTSALLRVMSLYDMFYGRKQIKRTLADESSIGSILKLHTSSVGKTGKPLKDLALSDSELLMDDIEKECIANTDEILDYKSKIEFQKNVLGFVTLLTGEVKDRPLLFIKAMFPVKRKRDGVQFGYSIIGQSIGSGITTRYTIFNSLYKQEPVQENDVIKCISYARDEKNYFTITDYRVVGQTSNISI